MKKTLLPPPSNLFEHLSPKSTQLIATLLLVLTLGFNTGTTAQCIGPYQTFESFKTVPAGWSLNSGVTSFASAGNAQSRSGTNLLQQTGTNLSATSTTYPSVITTAIVNPKTVSFYVNKSAAAGAAITYVFQYSPDNGANWYTIPAGTNTVNGVSITGTIPVLPTTTGIAGWNLVSAVFNTNNPLASYKFRISDTRAASTNGSLWIDDFSATTYTTSPNDNTIIVSELGSSTTCNSISVPSTGSYTYYDQGGVNDGYNKSQTQVMYFSPQNGTDKVKLYFNSFAVDALTKMTVYNGNGTTVGTEFSGLNAVNAVAAGTTVTSTDPSGYITVVFTSSTGTAQAGFDITVSCVGSPNITGLSATNGCLGSSLTITGTNLASATSVTINGTAATIGVNTSTSVTVTPGAGTTSGPVVFNSLAGTATSATNYTIDATPSFSAGPSAATQNICLNGSATALSVTANNGGGTISKYEWYSNTTASTSGGTLVATNNTSATTNTYTPLTTTQGTLYYYVVVSNTTGCSATSAVSGAIVVDAPVVITAQPSTASQSLCLNDASTALSVTATGGSLGYQWYSNTVNSNSGGTLISGATSSTYTPLTNSFGTKYYYCVVSNGAPCSSSVTSAVSGNVTINPAPTVVSVTGGGSYCGSATLNASNGSSGTIYWQGTTSNGTSTATASTSQSVSASGTYYFRAQSAAGCWGNQGSATVTIETVTPGVATATAATGITTTGFTANWTAGANATGYYLDVATDAGFTSMVAGYSNLNVNNVLTYAITGLANSTTYYYRVRAYRNGCVAANSNTISCATTSPSYCTPNGSAYSQDPQGITNVTMGTINNTTGIEVTNYGNYTAFSTNVYAGATQSFSVTYRTGYTYDTSIWVDWNNDGDFADAGELVYQGNSASTIPATVTGSFAVPVLNSDSTSTIGAHRLRIGGTDFGPLTDPCRNGSWQAFEDYTLNVISVPPCSVSVPSALTTINVAATSATLVWSDSAMTPNTIYNYYVSTSNVAPPADGSNPVGMGTVTGALSANITGLTLGQTYYFWIRVKCDATNYSAWIGSATFTTSTLVVVNMSNGSQSTCNAKFYDSGGFSSVYTSGETYTYTFSPASGNNLKVVFNSFNTEPGYDFLSIYDGPNTSSTLLGTYSGTQIAAGQAFYSSAANGGSLTFKFVSDGSLTYSGWDANITCVNVPTITSFSPTFACAGSTPSVTLTGTNFTTASSVTFNGVAAAFTVVNSTTITATLPASATSGSIVVNTPDASGSSSSSFVVRPVPSTPNAGADVVICAGQSTNLSIAPVSTTGSLATTQVGGSGCTGGNMFNIVSGPSPITLNAFDIVPNSTGLQSVNVYYKVGTYVGSETNAAAWTLLGTYSVNGVAKVLINMPTANLVIPAATTYGIYINYDASYTIGSNTYSNTDLTINTGAGLCGSFSGVNASRTFNGKVYYLINATPTYAWTPSTGLSSAAVSNPVATPSSTTTYTVTTTVNGCTSLSDDVKVTVNPLPTATIPTAGGNICANSVVPITVTGVADSFTWTSSAANTLFTDATGSTPYIAGTNTTLVYIKTAVSATVTVTATNVSTCFVTASVSFSVVTKTFSGGLWTPAGPPANDGTENLVFAAGTYNSSGNLSGCSCTVSGATVTFNSGHNLSLVNGLTVSSGSITFNDGASLLQTNNVANTGNIIYKRNSTPCFKYDYTYWSSPVAGQTLVNLSPNSFADGFFEYNPTIPSWQQIFTGNTMSIGKGYLIRVPNTYPDPLYAPAQPFTAVFTGVPNNGTIPLTVVHNPASELNLIGNPYPSALNATALVTDPGFNVNGNFLGGTLYFWSHNTNLNMTTGQYTYSDYAVWNVLGGVNTYYSGNLGSGNTNAPNGNIAAGQGFFAKTLASGTAYFRNSMRTGGATNTNPNFYRNSSSTHSTSSTSDNGNTFEKHRIWLDIDNGADAYKQVLVGYIEGGTDGLDRLFDGEMVDNGNDVTFYSKVDNTKLTIQGRGLTFAPTDTFALGYKAKVANTYTITLSDFDGLFADQAIYLEDQLLNVVHNLKAGAYTFASEAGEFEHRFVLRFTSETLGVPTFSENSVVVYKNTDGLFVNSGQVPMQSVAVYDVTGRLITTQNHVNATQVRFATLPKTNQVLLVKITSETGAVVTKKVLY